METVNSDIKMEPDIKDNGNLGKSMGKALISNPMVINTAENINTDSSMDKASLGGSRGRNIMENGKKASNMGKGGLSFLMVKFMSGLLKVVFIMELPLILGQMVRNTLGYMVKIEEMVKVKWYGPTVPHTQANGRTATQTVQAP